MNVERLWPEFKFEFGTIFVYKNLQELVTWIYTMRTWKFILWEWEYSLDPNLLVNIDYCRPQKISSQLSIDLYN